MKRIARLLTVVLGILSAAGCAPARQESGVAPAPALAGGWRSSVQFGSGAFASVRDLEFMYVFHAGGTMTESSNYDGAPPVPPAYGIWRETGLRQFEARYEFFATKPPAKLEDIAAGGGWLPAGRGVIVEKLLLSEDGRTFTSTLRYEAFDAAGKPVSGGGEATGRGVRMEF